MLVKSGVPFHLAFGHTDRLQPVEINALSIIFQELDGATFNWNALRFEEPK